MIQRYKLTLEESLSHRHPDTQIGDPLSPRGMGHHTAETPNQSAALPCLVALRARRQPLCPISVGTLLLK